jgi:hypothetical protein
MLVGEKLWRLRLEIEVEPGDLDLEFGCTKGFINVVTWASSDESARGQVKDYLATFNWKLLGVDESNFIDSSVAPEFGMGDLIERARGNSDAIILGTFHAYREAYER